MPWPYSIPVADSFNRADGAIGSSWGSWPSTFYTVPFIIESNVARGQIGENSSRFLTSYGPDMGAYATFAVEPGAFGGIFIRADGTTDGHGYGVTWIASGSVFRLEVGGSTIASATQAMISGASIGIEAVGTAIKGWYRASSGGSWVNLLTATDSTITAAGYAGMYADQNNTSFEDFSAGTVSGGGGAPTYHGRQMMTLGM
jgi:hypothetical protein